MNIVHKNGKDFGRDSSQARSSDLVRRLFAYVDHNSDRFVREVQELIRQPSISAQGVGMKDCAKLLQRKMEAVGMDARILPTKGGYPVVFGKVKSIDSAPTILCYGHYDVQPPEPLDEWISPPFSAQIRGGIIYGRGASDMKCGLMAAIKSVEACMKVLGKVPVNIKMIFEGEEEVSSPHLAQFVRDNKQLLKADARLDCDGSIDIILGDKGMLYVQLTATEARQDFHSREATILVSPIWRLVWALSSLKDQTERVMIEGFYDNVRKPTFADLKLIEQLSLNRDELYNGQLLDNLETKREIFRRRLFSPTCNISGIISGYTGLGPKAVLPHIATAKVDIRLVPDQDPDEILKKLTHHLVKRGFNNIRVTTLGKLWPSKTSGDEQFVKVVIKSAEVAHHRKLRIEPIAAGSGPSYIFSRYLKLPSVATGAATTIKCNHAPNEYVRVRDYLDGIKKFALIFRNFGKTDTSIGRNQKRDRIG